MPKETKEDLENVFGGFKLIDQQIPASVVKDDKTDKTEKKPTAQEKAALEAEEKALAEALAAANKDKAEKDAKIDIEGDENEELEIQEAEEEIQEDEDINGITLFAKELADKGLLDLDESDKIESDDDLFKAYKKTIKKAVDIDRASIHEDGQKFLEFLDNGGDPKEFHKFYYGDGATFEEFEIESEEDQEYIVRQGLALEEYTDEEIEEEITDLKDSGKMSKKAEMHLKKLQKVEKEQKKAFLESQKEYAKKEEAKREAEWTEFKKGLFEKEEISGFKFNEKMKNDTWDYMTKIVDRKKSLTQYQIDSASNPDARYIFAYLLKNKWDIKSLEKQVKTKVVGNLASKLNNYSDGRSKISKGSAVKPAKDENANPFKGFKAFIDK